MSAFRAPRAPRPPRFAPRLPPPPRAPRPVAYNATTLAPTPEAPPGFAGSANEWAIWDDLTRRRGWRIFSDRMPWLPGWGGEDEADAIYQPALPAVGANVTKDFFRGDFLIVPGGKGPNPGPPYQNGIVLDPINSFTHDTPGDDIVNRSVLTNANYLLVWIEEDALRTRPHDVITAALYGADDSSVDRGSR